ncbi:MAG: DUF4142 domain-containing protein, partial [Candidatus Eremiobacteraeota bacterium]|nr:DUF4142 domain-containing protein [Candidatus Eremiobacteraeota bacterium]
VQTAQAHVLGQYALAALAAGKAQDPHVKTFAQKVTADAGNANMFIKRYAAAHNVAISNRPHVRAETQYGDIESLKGKAFDDKFVTDIGIDAQLASDDYKDEADHGSDPQLKAFAKQHRSFAKAERDGRQTFALSIPDYNVCSRLPAPGATGG